jgi:hypothetical protein
VTTVFVMNVGTHTDPGSALMPTYIGANADPVQFF